jgi:hypothetical protein
MPDGIQMDLGSTDSPSPSFTALGLCVMTLAATFAWLHYRVVISGRLGDTPHPERGYLFCIALIVLAVGLIALRRWAAVLVAAAGAGIGAWLAIGSLLHVPWPFVPINMCLAALCFVPALLTSHHWRALK